MNSFVSATVSPDQRVTCTNLIGRFRAPRPSQGILLIGSHFDTRLTADREENPHLRTKAILGANDGGSGTAVLLDLLEFLQNHKNSLHRDVYVVFFDAEDVGDIAGLPFSLGARVFVDHPVVPLPAEALILDMIGGCEMVLDIDGHVFSHPPSLDLTHQIFSIGLRKAYKPFGAVSLSCGADKRAAPTFKTAHAFRTAPTFKTAHASKTTHGMPPGATYGATSGVVNKTAKSAKFIVSDHFPFLLKGIPNCILIDLDYPEWHTLRDTPEAVCGESLAMIADVLQAYVLTDPE